MLEAFVDKLKGRSPHYWIDAEESIANMHWLDKIYEKVCDHCSLVFYTKLTLSTIQGGLPLRPNSVYTPGSA
jgi:hypothetical protein